MSKFTKNKKIRYGMLIAFAVQLLLPILIPCQAYASQDQNDNGFQIVICSPGGLKTISIQADTHDSGENQTDHSEIDTVCAICGTMACQAAIHADQIEASFSGDFYGKQVSLTATDIGYEKQSCPRHHTPRAPPAHTA